MPRAKSTDDLHFFDPRASLAHGKNRLPHWDQSSATFFVTFRLADSIPAEKLTRWRSERAAWLASTPPPHTAEQEHDYHDQFTARIEAWLDLGAGNCALRDPATRAITAASFAPFDGARHWQHAWVVMPNHVHLLFSLLAPHTLEALLQSWKGFTAHATNRILGKAGDFWMRDYFDRLIRDSTHFWRCARYIRRNPESARLSPHQSTLFEAPFVNDFLNSERYGGFPAADAPSLSAANSAAGKPPFR